MARPYARALFELAQSRSSVEDWLAALQHLAAFFADRELQDFLKHPKVSDAEKLGVLQDLAQGYRADWLDNLLSLLLFEKKTALFPSIAELFLAYHHAAQQTLAVQVRSAFPLDAVAVTNLQTLLGQRFGARQVTMDIGLDPSLIAGVTIHFGDKTIDASVRGQLAELTASITK
jgi:F-type H+-transporting ATPase subunit delta